MNKTLIKKLDTVFSEYVRLRDSDVNGYCKCISCSTRKYYKEMDAGHYINRKHMSLRYDEVNVNAQCRSCNRFDEGNIPAYGLALIHLYGKNIIERLLFKKNQVSKMSDGDGRLLLEHYKQEIKKLKSNKNLR